MAGVPGASCIDEVALAFELESTGVEFCNPPTMRLEVPKLG